MDGGPNTEIRDLGGRVKLFWGDGDEICDGDAELGMGREPGTPV